MQVSTVSAVTTSIVPPILPAVSTTSVSSTVSVSSSTVPVIEYPLEGGVTICDKTNGLAQVIFSQELTNQYKQSAYQVSILGKKIVLPTCSNPKIDRLIFTGSLRISFERRGDFIEMIERDAASATTYYIDPRKVVEDVAYDAYSYVPMEINEKDAQLKIKNLKTDFLTEAVGLYNRHGVAVFGYEMGKYVLYWANPSEESVSKVTCSESECYRRRDGGSSIAKAADGKVNFRYYPRDKVFALNGEPATPLPIPGAAARSPLPLPFPLGAATRLPLPLPLPLTSSSTTAHSSTPSNAPLPASTDRKEAKS